MKTLVIKLTDKCYERVKRHFYKGPVQIIEALKWEFIKNENETTL